MFRAQICAVLGFGLMLAAASTEARELELSVESRIAGDSNVFRSSSDRKADGFIGLSPRIVVREANSNLNYQFSYRPTYDAYFKTDGINGFDHRAQGGASWRPTAVDTLGFSGIYSSVRSLRLEDESGAASPAPSLQASDRERLEISNARLSYGRKLTDVLSVQASGAFRNLDYSRDTSIDSSASSGELSTQYVLDPITSVGLIGTFRHRDSGGQGRQFTTKTDIWEIGASIQRSLTPTLSISAQAGPSFIRTKEEAPPVTPAAPRVLPDSKSRSTSYFASVIMDKTWQRSDLRASYTRSDSNGGGNSTSAITDSVTLNFDHSFSRRWSGRVSGTWLQSKEISAVPGTVVGGGKQKTTQYRVFTSFTNRISRQLSVTGQFSYFNQDENDVRQSDSIGGIFSGYLSLQYTFDPFVF
jgi:hypothetical protein